MMKAVGYVRRSLRSDEHTISLQKVRLLPPENSGWLIVILLALAVVGVGCTKAHLSHNLLSPNNLAPEDAVAVVLNQFSGESSGATEAKFVGCITKAIRKAHPTVRIVAQDESRQVAFPDLPPEEVSPGDRSWEYLADDAPVRQRVAPLGVHYLIALSGGTTQDVKFRFVPSGTMHGGLIHGGDVGDRQSSLSATIINLKKGTEAGHLYASARNTSRFGWMPLPFPFYAPSRHRGPRL